MSTHRPFNHGFVRLALSCLLIFACSSSALSAGDDPPVDRLKLVRDLDAQYRGGNYQKALEICEKLQKMEPNEAAHLYNLACLHCLLGNKTAAYEWLEKAVDAGYKDADNLGNDPDFRTIRGEDRFRALLRRVREGNIRTAEGRHEEHREKKPTRQATEGKRDHEDNEPPAKRGRTTRKSTVDDHDAEEVASRVQELTSQMVEAAKAEEYDKALKIALRAQKLADIGVTNYNVACMYSMLEKKDEAFKYLEAAVKKGDFPADLATQMEQDDDLENLRGDPRYAKLLERARGGEKPVHESEREMKKVKFEWKVTLPGKQGAAKPPLLVVLHAARGNMNEAAETWKDAAAEVGAVLLTPQGTYQGGKKSYEWGDNLDEVEENILEAVEKVSDDHGVNKRRIILAGTRHASTIAWKLGARHPELFHGLLIMCVKCELKPESAFDDPDAKQLRVVVLCSGDEKKAKANACKLAVEKLKKKGVAVQFISRQDGVRGDDATSGKDEQVRHLQYLLED